MKRYLVKLNHPVIEESPCNISKKTTIYGFLGPYKENDEELETNLISDIDDYVGYLASMNQWSTKTEKEFDVKEPGITYTLYLIDLDGIEGECLGCGIDKTLIICESLMDNLTRLAEQQKNKEEKESYNVVLFNRPIWLPNHILWEEEVGFSHIYGLVLDEEIDSKLLDACNLYLGYLAMIEELMLNDVTPSGYTADVENDGVYWYDRGEKYTCISDKLKKECHLCRHKHNLKLRGAVVRVPVDELNESVRDGYILSQELYEKMREIVANADYESGCQN